MTPGPLIVAGLVALAVWWAQLPATHRLRAARARDAASGAVVRWPPQRWPVHPDAWPLSVRRSLGIGSGAALGLLTRQLVPMPGAPSWALAALVGLLVSVSVTVGLGRVVSPAAARRRELVALQLPTVIELLTAAVEAGLPLQRAVSVVAEVAGAPISEDLAGVARRTALGQRPREAWAVLRGQPAWARVADDLGRAEAHGTPAGPLLVRLGEDLREDQRGRLQTAARTVGVRSVLPLMVCFLPAFALVGVVPIVAGAVLAWLS